MTVELPHNARRIDPYEARDAETGAWERATNESVENVEDLEERGRFAVTFSDGSDHQVVLVEDDAGYVGACDCNGFAFHGDQPGAGCAHVYLLCQMDALSSNTVPEVDDVDVIDGDDMDVDVVEHGADAGDDVQEASADPPEHADHAGETVDDVVDVSDAGVPKGNGTPPGEAKSPALDDPFAGALEDVDDRFVMTLGGDPYIRREGFQRLARREGYRVETEMRTWASDTDCELAEASARVLDEDGEVVATGTGTAYLPEEDLAGAKGNLNELAETRALSRAMGWATGAGLSAVEVDASAEFDDADREVATDGGR